MYIYMYTYTCTYIHTCVYVYVAIISVNQGQSSFAGSISGAWIYFGPRDLFWKLRSIFDVEIYFSHPIHPGSISGAWIYFGP